MRCVRLLCLLVGVGACEGAAGDDPVAHGELWWSASDASFSVRFLSPPWQVARLEPAQLELEISPEVFGVALEGSPATHVFRLGTVEEPAGLEELVGGEAAAQGIPDHLDGIDLTDAGTVALAELDHLLDEEDAQLDRELEPFVTDRGQEGLVWQVIVAPGLFVRGFYFAGRSAVVRGIFVSLFQLRTADVDAMARSIETVE